MKHLLRLALVSILIPFALLAGKGALRTTTLTATTCNVETSQDCLLITGSGYAASKNVTIEAAGLTSQMFSAPANRNGDIAIYIYETFEPGYYTVTSYQSLRISATTGFDVP